MGCFLFMANVVPMVSLSSSSSQTPVFGSTRVIVMRRKFSRVSTVSTAIKQFYLIKSEVIFVLLICTTCLCICPDSDARISPLGRLGGAGWRGGGLLAGNDLRMNEWIQVLTEEQPGSCLVWLQKQLFSL